LHVQWPLTSKLHGSFPQREQLFFFVTDQTPRLTACSFKMPLFLYRSSQTASPYVVDPKNAL
jgi:hypothetical protein